MEADGHTAYLDVTADVPAAGRKRIWGRREIESLIARGSSVIIVEGQVLKVDAWIPYHPGGEKAISHMVGRDATDEVNA